MPRCYRLILLCLPACCMAGCRYDGAFMHMDSNSPFPFLGFQLAVDTGVRPERRSDSGAETRRREEVVPLLEHSPGELGVPNPRLQRLYELSPGRGLPSLPVRLKR